MPSPNRMRRRLGGGVTPISSPLELSGLAFWFRAPNLALADGTAVATWADLSGNGRDLTQATGANQPVYKTGIQNGLAVVRFTAANSTVMATASFTLNQPSTICLAASDTAPGHSLCDGLANDTRNTFRLNSSSLSIFAGATLTNPSGASATFNAIQAIFSSANSVLRVNAAEAGGNAGTAAAAGLRVGTGGNSFAGMDLGEIFGYSRALSAQERGRVGAYLRQRWATP